MEETKIIAFSPYIWYLVLKLSAVRYMLNANKK